VAPTVEATALQYSNEQRTNNISYEIIKCYNANV